MSDQRNKQKQQGGKGGQQGGGGQKSGQQQQQPNQKPGQAEQAELNKKRKRWREIGKQQEEEDKKWGDVVDPGQEPGTGSIGT